MATKNISELVKSVTEYDDLTNTLAERFKDFHGGNYSLYGYSYFGKNDGSKEIDYVSLLGKNIGDVDAAIETAWNVTGLKTEDGELKLMHNYCTIIVTDNDGNIVKETPRRYFAG